MKAVDALLNGLVDYAGLFPPAKEDMRRALENYSAYRTGADRQALGRFIVPVARLEELEQAGKDLIPRGPGSEPWRLSVLVANDVRAAGDDMLKFNSNHWSGSPDGHAVIDVAELKAETIDAIEHQRSELPPIFTPYFEIPTAGAIGVMVDALARVGARAKIRTGGVTADVFPSSREVVAFIVACHREGVPFKATAGLHHPIRGAYRLTYEPTSSTTTMYGFLNVFLAAAFVYLGESEDTARAVLEESDPAAFTFTDDAIIWRHLEVDVNQINAFRSDFAVSFGSCSFREPVDELAALDRASLTQNR